MHRSRVYPLFIAAALAFMLLPGCKTPPPPAPAPTDPTQSSSLQAESAGLAPSGDPHFRTINFAVLVGNRDQVKGWTFTIVDPKATVVRTIAGDAANIPDTLSWDGKGDSGSLAPEGPYQAALAIDYGTAFTGVTVKSKSFILDITPPSGSFKLNPARFTPAPGGVKGPVTATVEAKQALVKIAGWTIDVYDASGLQIAGLSAAWPSNQASWDGRTESGAFVEAGKTYPAVLRVRDEFGNTSTFRGSFPVADITAADPSTIQAGRVRAGFSPTSASGQNSIDILLTFGSKDSVAGWTVTVTSASKGAIRTFSGDRSSLPESLQWNGRDDSAVLAAEGSYFATLAVDYGAAYKPSLVRSNTFSLVTTPPAGSITVDPPVVSLAELGPKKPVTLTVQAKSTYAMIADWKMSVLGPDGSAVALFNANWPNNKVAWDGKTLSGGSLDPETTYSVVAVVQDEYGNVGRLAGSLATEALKPVPEPTSISAMGAGFAPEGDGTFPTIDLSLQVGNAQSVKSWRVDVVGADKIARRSFSSADGKVPMMLTWDGKGDSGALVPEGYYKAQLSIDYGKVFSPVAAESAPFLLDRTPPAGNVVLAPALFSPDGDGNADTVAITISAGSALAKVTGWSLSILDPEKNIFASFKGSWPKNGLTWDGVGANGELVESASDYVVSAKVRDEYGMVGELSSVLATDILVMKTDRGYRVRVPSIVFKPYTANYRDLPPERAARNIATLDLLAFKLAKFPDYKIRLEGHAVMINWDDHVKGTIEQESVLIPLSIERAEAIKAALAERGISATRFTAEGAGAKNPIVPDSDFANRWRNRRVEFFLEK